MFNERIDLDVWPELYALVFTVLYFAKLECNLQINQFSSCVETDASVSRIDYLMSGQPMSIQFT